MSHRNFFDNDSPAEISEARIHRNFWDNDPQKFLGRLERINFWGPFCRRNFWRPYCRRNFWDPFCCRNFWGPHCRRNFWGPYCRRNFCDPFYRRNFWGPYCRRNFWDPSGPPKYLRQRFDCRNYQDHWTSKMSKYHLVCSKKCLRYTEDQDIDLHSL